MKIVVIGATGTIGAAVAAALEGKHEVVRASRRGDVRVDMGDPESISALFESVGGVDAVLCCAANVELTPLASLSDEELAFGMKGKLLGQVNLVRRSLGRLRDGGSITLTGGTFARPIPGSAIGALVNSGLEGFVRSAALDMPRGLRLNAVSPGWVKETLEKMGLDGTGATTARDVARLRGQRRGDDAGTDDRPEGPLRAPLSDGPVVPAFVQRNAWICRGARGGSGARDKRWSEEPLLDRPVAPVFLPDV